MNIAWTIRKDSAKEYKVLECKDMPSLVGMFGTGKPKAGVPSIFAGNGDGYRTIKPLRMSPVDENKQFFIYTEVLKLKVERIY